MPENTEDQSTSGGQLTSVPQAVSPTSESNINSIISPQPKKTKGRVWLALGVVTVLLALGAATYLVQRQSFNQSYAWNCTQYVFNVSQDGIVTVDNNSTRNEPAQNAQVYINETLAATLTVPALTSGANATLGSVDVPLDAGFTWRVEGSLDCEDSGAYTLENSPTPNVTHIVSVTPTPTVSTTVSPTISPTVSVTASPSPTGSVSPTVSPTNSPTPTSVSGSAQGTGDALADAGVSLPTILGLGLGILLIAGALILAI